MGAFGLDAGAVASIMPPDDLVDEGAIGHEVVEVPGYAHQKGVANGALEMAVRAFDRAVLMRDALVVACGRHAVVGAELLVALREIGLGVGVEIAEGRRETVAAVIGRRSAQRPERILHPLGQGDEAFAAENDMAMLEAGLCQAEVIEDMVERPAGDGYAERTQIGEVGETDTARFMRLAEDDLLLLAVNGTP